MASVSTCAAWVWCRRMSKLENESDKRFHKLDKLLWWDKYSAVILYFCLSGVFGAFWLYLTYREPHHHDSYVVAEVLFTHSIASEEGGFSFFATVRLPDGTEKTVGTKSVALSGQVASRACIEQRLGESGRMYHKLVPTTRCSKNE